MVAEMKFFEKEILKISKLPLKERVEAINQIREMLHEISPFKNEPVDFVRWVPEEQLEKNEYNPNVAANPEFKLLCQSVELDGVTMPIVAWKRDDAGFQIVDGFHRSRVIREHDVVRVRMHGYMPLSVIRQDREDKGDRIASTIRHNRARGKHTIAGMSDIIVELKRRNWSDAKIGKELGMEQDEVLRLSQISGLAELFADQEFSEAWEVNDDG